jgi:acyl carrier protein
MIDINKILEEICNDKRVNDDNFDLIESGLLDSYTMIELFVTLEDNNIELYPTQIKRDDLRTPGKIKKIIKEYIEKNK